MLRDNCTVKTFPTDLNLLYITEFIAHQLRVGGCTQTWFNPAIVHLSNRSREDDYYARNVILKRSSLGTDFETCRECCETDACNLKGCGKDIVDIKRGPICFNCDGITDPTKCHRIKVCEADEICQALSGSFPIIGRRRRSIISKLKRSVLCSKCCSNDLCNTHCGTLSESSSTTPPITTELTTSTVSVKTTVPTTTSTSLPLATGYYEYYVMFTEPAHPLSFTPLLYMLSEQNGTVMILSLSENKSESIQLSSGENKSVSKNVIGIVSTANVTTHVKIKLNLRNDTKLSFNSVEYNNSDILSVNLTKLETLQISHDFDLSGSIITSSHPIGVVSGNICNSITHYFCNLFTEMILPTKQLDNTFIVPTIEGRHSRVVRVYAPDPTQLQVFTSNKEFHVMIKKEDFYEFEDSEMSIIRSENNVLVMVYPKEEGDYDSYMMTVHGTNQYKTSYNIIVPGSFTSYISMTFTSGSADGFQIDQKKEDTKSHFNKTISGTTYTTVSYAITPGAHKITYESNIRYRLWIYGDRHTDGYGFPGGIAYTT
ncbi:unnamed protein product [Mytilus coruscus]|uniref:IgGFc-binding protein N-terminal domain-containing protein n=1 Tax=Mytilus coruscus TaxID=42192 RepID=A0A6J8CQT9_MYTCO|nr:unnamed protein product [Mytilus coruscus]